MRVALAQLNAVVGDLKGNAARIAEAMAEARAGGAALAVFPELAITGYAPRDLLFRDDFVRDALETTAAVARAAEGVEAIVGTIERAGPAPGGGGRGALRSVAAHFRGGAVAATVAKRVIPAGGALDGSRWFVPGAASAPLAVAGRPLGLLVSEDLGDATATRDLLGAGAALLAVIAAAPYAAGTAGERLAAARRHGAPLVHVNAVGGEDELIFDGGSFVLDGRGRLLASLPRFEERIEIVDLDAGAPGSIAPRLEAEEEVFSALVLGIRDFLGKNGVRRAFVGISGGIDSALVACMAREAVGPAAVTALALPSRFTDPRSTACAAELARALGIGFEVLPIEPLHAACEAALAGLLEGDEGTTAENIQARLRALILMAHVNRRGGILLNTSNKTEAALGYGTLYGDMAGGLGVLADLTKTAVYALARWYDRKRGGVIPPFTFERPPSAELTPGQVDPFDYALVDPLVEALVAGTPPADLVARGAPPAEVRRLARLIAASEHKRWQAPPALRVSRAAFGRGRLMPITNRYAPG